ncbi:battenin-like [Antedon mediterranea]|uniref:battenin-like n=1 Tax=Antedon mediterranea TaxID=105859 RepID=UPI003AF7782A
MDQGDAVNSNNGSCLPNDNAAILIKQPKTKRDVVAFFLLGLCNNFCYGIMLSAAFDILSEFDKKYTTTISPVLTTASLYTNITTSEPLNYKDCNKVSTGAVLLADIFPSLFAKTTLPLYFEYVSYNLMISISISLGAASLLIVSYSNTLALSLIGVGCASAGTGIGEFLFLSLSSYFDKSVIVGYSTGTGVSGVLYALAYVLLTSVLGLSPRQSMLIVLVVPAVSFIVYYLLLSHRPSNKKHQKPKDELSESLINNIINSSQTSLQESVNVIDDITQSEDKVNGSLASKKGPHRLTAKEKIKLVKPLTKYMVPLGVVYLAEYLINQGIVELIYFPTLTWMNHDDQYRWYQLVYQVGVFVSRSSIAVFTIKHLWVLPILQCAAFVFLLTVAMYHYIPSIWIIFVTIAFEGLLGGFAFANTFYKILIEVEECYQEFAMGLTSIASSLGITISGLVSIPLHNALCKS